MPQGNNEYGVTQEALDWLKAQIDTPDDSGIVRVPEGGLDYEDKDTLEYLRDLAGDGTKEGARAGCRIAANRIEALTRTQADDRKRIGEVRTYIAGLRADGFETRADDFGRAIRWIDASLSKPLIDGATDDQ